MTQESTIASGSTTQRVGVPSVKRTLDLVLASVTGVLLAPLLLLTALAVKLDSKGPVIFVQERVGARRVSKDGDQTWEQTTFRVYKFRSMFVDADQRAHEDYIEAFVNGESYDEEGEAFKMTDDPRVTRVGRLIRRTSIDELPQLANVLKGDMSLVGPRPVPPYEVDGYDEWHKERLDALPGMTGYWQVYGRGVVPFDEMVEMDIHYVRNQSVWMDVKLLAMTLPAVIMGKGAG